ncbi:MAG: TSUP family transporter [Lautropia sp.]
MESWLPDGLSIAAALALVAASFVTAAVSATFGIGGGVAMLVVMLALLPPAIVLPLHGVVQTGSNAGRAVTLLRHVRRAALGWFTAGTVVGIVAASFVFVALPTRTLAIVLGGFILWVLWGPTLSKRPISDRSFVAVGAVASFCTMFVGATGPMVGAFWNVRELGKLGVVATHAAAMVVQHAAKVIAFGALGFGYTAWLPLLAALLIAGQLGTQLGARILQRLPERVFEFGFKWLLTALALRLLWTAIAGD